MKHIPEKVKRHFTPKPTPDRTSIMQAYDRMCQRGILKAPTMTGICGSTTDFEPIDLVIPTMKPMEK